MCNAPAGYQVYLNAGDNKVVGRSPPSPLGEEKVKYSRVHDSDFMLNDLQKRRDWSSLLVGGGNSAMGAESADVADEV